MPVSRDEVIQAYRYILGREPEGESAIADHMRDHADFATLRQVFLASDELARQVKYVSSRQPMLAATLPLVAPPLHIETKADPATLEQVVARTARFWEAIGETAPHWSVITSPDFQPERMAENEEKFFQSANPDRELLLTLLQRVGRPPQSFRKVVEFGCGVGRFTSHLAGIFEQVVGLDISRPHLRLAEQTMHRFGRTNVSFAQVTPQNLHPAEGFDLWFCRIVLQHNPPPVIMHILDRMFRLMEPGGIAIFQVPTYQVGYRFSIAEYLTGDLGQHMEMHCVPQRAVLDLGYQHRCQLLEIREDTPVVSQTPDWLSNNFIFQKT